MFATNLLEDLSDDSRRSFADTGLTAHVSFLEVWLQLVRHVIGFLSCSGPVMLFQTLSSGEGSAGKASAVPGCGTESGPAAPV